MEPILTDPNMSRNWQDDREYEQVVLESVERSGDGYAITQAGGGTLWVADPGFVPLAGQTARFFGRGFGYPVRGVVIEGQVCYYHTPAEEETCHAEQTAKFQADVKAQTEAARAAGRDEKAMRDEKAPWPKTIDELSAYITALVEGPHDYGTCVYAVSLATVATFNYMAGTMGITGFQASMADLDVLRRTRNLQGPFMIIDASDALYPQYDLPGKLAEAMEKWRPWLAEQARKKLADSATAHPNVRAHWKRLAEDARV